MALQDTNQSVQTAASLLPKTTTQSSTFNPVLMGAMNDTLTAARGVANQAYTPYTGAQVAGFTPDQLQAMQSTRDSYMSTIPQYQQGTSLVNQGTNVLNQAMQTPTWNASVAQQYMNPYIQNVVQNTTNNALRTAEIERNKLNQQAALSGSFGGSRNAIAQQELMSNTGRNINDATGQLLASGYDTAYNQYSGDRDFALKAAEGYNTQAGALAGSLDATRAAQTDYTKNLAAQGQAQQVLGQQNLDVAKSNFMDQRDYNKNQLEWLNSMLTGTNINNFRTGTTETTKTQGAPSSSNWLSSLGTTIGTAQNAANAIGTLKGIFGYAEGGLVKGYANGTPDGEVVKAPYSYQAKPLADYTQDYLSSVPFADLTLLAKTSPAAKKAYDERVTSFLSSAMNQPSQPEGAVTPQTAVVIPQVQQQSTARYNGGNVGRTTPPFNPIIPTAQPPLQQQPVESIGGNSNSGGGWLEGIKGITDKLGEAYGQMTNLNPSLEAGLRMRVQEMDIDNPEWWTAYSQLTGMEGTRDQRAAEAKAALDKSNTESEIQSRKDAAEISRRQAEEQARHNKESERISSSGQQLDYSARMAAVNAAISKASNDTENPYLKEIIKQSAQTVFDPNIEPGSEIYKNAERVLKLSGVDLAALKMAPDQQIVSKETIPSKGE